MGFNSGFKGLTENSGAELNWYLSHKDSVSVLGKIRDYEQLNLSFFSASDFLQYYRKKISEKLYAETSCIGMQTQRRSNLGSAE